MDFIGDLVGHVFVVDAKVRHAHLVHALEEAEIPLGDLRCFLRSAQEWEPGPDVSLLSVWSTRGVVHRIRELLRRERMAGIGLLAADVAHEINNPMNANRKAAVRLLGISEQ